MHCYYLPIGVYGDVQRVKIMFNKKDNALIQFADAMQAQTGKNKSSHCLQMLSTDILVGKKLSAN